MLFSPVKSVRPGFVPHLLAPGLALLLATAALAAPPVVSEDGKFQSISLDRSRQNHLLIHVRINGKPALLGVDSGAPVSAISISRRKHFGVTEISRSSHLPARLRINGGYNKVVIAHALEIGALTLVDEPMVAINLSGTARPSREYNEPELDGILGADILFPTQAVLDCEKQILYMKLDPDAPGTVPGIDHRGWQGVPIRVTEGWNLYVDTKLNGRPCQLMIDTGAFITLLHEPFLSGLGLDLRDTPYTSGGVNLADSDLKLTTIKDFAIGQLAFGKFILGAFKIAHKEVGVMDLSGLIRSDLLKGEPPVAGLLGSEFLRRNHGIIDFGTRMLYLKL